METKNISISDNRVAVSIDNGKTVQFVIWDLEKEQHKSLELQIKTGFAICESLEDVEKHLRINGFDASIEDVY